MRYFLNIVAFSLFASACDQLESTTDDECSTKSPATCTSARTDDGKNVADSDSKDKPDTGHDIDIPAGYQAFDAALKDVSYDKAAHVLLATVTYPSCADPEFRIVVGVCLESFPAQCTGEVFIKKSGSCTESRTEQKPFKLPEGLEDSYLSVKANGVASLLIDKDGSLGSLDPNFKPAAESGEIFDGAVRTATYDQVGHKLLLTIADLYCSGKSFSLKLDPVCKGAQELAGGICTAELRVTNPPPDSALCAAFGDLSTSISLQDLALKSGYSVQIRWKGGKSVTVAVP